MSLQTVGRSASEEDLIQGGRKVPVNVLKFPLGRLRLAIQKFQKVLQIDLERLQKHRMNMDRYIMIEDWKGLHKEQINASRTVQQVKATLRDLERTRAQVYEEELDQFDEQVQEVKLKALAATENFLCISQADHLHPDITYAPPGDHTDSIESSSLSADLVHPLSVSVMGTQQTLVQELHVVPENTQAAASWESLQQDMEELNELVHQFVDTVKEQGEGVDRIEDNVDQARDNVRESTLQLGKASKYKVAMFPVMGALIGGIVAGPVGLVAGAKIGGIAGALGGGVAGFAGGRYLKSRHSHAVSLEMQNLSDKSDGGRAPCRSTSTPELASPVSTSDNDATTSEQSGAFQHFFSWGQRKSHSESED
ncbi:hypothetical protein ACOMHN_000466 [Nucella lapillus]